jgi:hypothetical protein
VNQVNQSINLLALKDKNNTIFCAKLSARISSHKITSFPLFIVFLLHIVFFSLLLAWRSCKSHDDGDPNSETENVEQNDSRRDALPLELALGQKKS